MKTINGRSVDEIGWHETYISMKNPSWAVNRTKALWGINAQMSTLSRLPDSPELFSLDLNTPDVLSFRSIWDGNPTR
jgi:hypothetical protein